MLIVFILFIDQWNIIKSPSDIVKSTSSLINTSSCLTYAISSSIFGVTDVCSVTLIVLGNDITWYKNPLLPTVLSPPASSPIRVPVTFKLVTVRSLKAVLPAVLIPASAGASVTVKIPVWGSTPKPLPTLKAPRVVAEPIGSCNWTTQVNPS